MSIILPGFGGEKSNLKNGVLDDFYAGLTWKMESEVEWLPYDTCLTSCLGTEAVRGQRREVEVVCLMFHVIDAQISLTLRDYDAPAVPATRRLTVMPILTLEYAVRGTQLL